MPKKGVKKLKKKWRESLLSYVDVLKIRLPDCLDMSCPQIFEGTVFSYWEMAHLILMPDKSPLFILLGIPGISLTKLTTVLEKIKRPAMAMLIDPDTDEVTMLGKKGEKHLALGDINFSSLSNFLKASVMNHKQSDENDNPLSLGGRGSLVENLRQLKPDQALALEQLVNKLTHGLSAGSKNTDSEIWQEVARASLRILPAASKEPKFSRAAIAAIARSIVFLLPPERLKAVKNILELSSLGEGINLETKERLASVALAVAPSLNQDGLAQIIRDLKPKFAANEKISPSLAQIISLVQTRIQKN